MCIRVALVLSAIGASAVCPYLGYWRPMRGTARNAIAWRRIDPPKSHPELQVLRFEKKGLLKIMSTKWGISMMHSYPRAPQIFEGDRTGFGHVDKFIFAGHPGEDRRGKSPG